MWRSNGFTEIFKLCSIAITIPTSSFDNEYTISYMKRIKKYLKNSSLDNNLSNLSVIPIEKIELWVCIIQWLKLYYTHNIKLFYTGGKKKN